ncbi:hypothetical protein [Planomonospora parontospora]|uniref:hypothetical protein n=1 Tax=Planomonospora parontospora TaxID=58119 RepID=UPI00167091D1|nr:hypothetical protein [Planomonospora parontospora]GGL51552.1 hypothetical protein GCM10014719_61070 [Planomonospora parontospora subsp. antibiotica]GII20215.1 hypothetical protein Ppa05_69410 [Planomonospora parontospora subsp. antibiotica]
MTRLHDRIMAAGASTPSYYDLAVAASRVPGWEESLEPFYDLLSRPGGENAARSIRPKVGAGVRTDMLGKAKVIAAENVARYLTDTYTSPQGPGELMF